MSESTGGAGIPPWPEGSATGVGSLPGTDIAEAVRTVLGELPDLPYLPELPARGPGAEMIGRTAGLLVDLPVELYAARWRVTARPGRDARRTADLLERDLDTLTDLADGYTGALKVQVAGPWTLAASLELPVGGVLLRDPGAVRELTASLAEGLSRHLDDLRRRVPGASPLLQLDEPMLPAVLAGHVATESGFGTLRPVEAATASETLGSLIAAVGVPVVVHCCAPDAPVALMRSAGAAAVGLDLALATDLDPIGEAVDAGLGLFAGALPTSGPGGAVPRPDAAAAAARVRELWGKLGFPLADLPKRVVVTPACGLAGASPAAARAVTTATREAARRLLDEAYS
jgi:Cobalamin-independent synthase, Catalytic domain